MSQNSSLSDSLGIYQRISKNICSVIRGQDIAVRKLLAAFFSGQHVLLEDMPGTGKTTMAKALSTSIDCDFQRIQFTPDLLPSDVMGISIYDQQHQEFSFHQGPIFTHILLADEINRAPPRTQSALLEAMAEKQVSIDNKQYKLDDVFFVIATQNPAESHGTYPLPEAQLDRFGLRFSLGYVSVDQEIQMLNDQLLAHPLTELKHCANRNDVLTVHSAIKKITVSEVLKQYIVDIVAATREAKGVKIGASFRASLTLLQVSQALAMFDEQTFVSPDHIQEIAVSILAHRLLLDQKSQFSGENAESIVSDILDKIVVPT